MTFPDSWYMVLQDSELSAGGTRSVAALGTELSFRRAADGTVTAQDARGRARAVDVVHGMIAVWEGKSEPAFRLAPIEELAAPGWTSLVWERSPVLRARVEDMQRDVVDNDHFGTVHLMRDAETQAQTEGASLRSVSQGIINVSRIGLPPLLSHIKLVGRLEGLGLLTYRTTVTLGVALRSVVLTAPMPVDDEHAVMHVGTAVPRSWMPGAAPWMRRQVRRSVIADIMRDAPRWEQSLERHARGAAHTGLMGMYDAWMQQFTPRQVGAAESLAS